MNTEERQIELLSEIRDLLREITKMFSKQEILPKEKSKPKDNWSSFFSSKQTKNSYFIVALALYYLTDGDEAKIIKTKELKEFLEINVADMNGKNINTIITHTLSIYGYIHSAGHGKYRINATTKTIVETLPDEASLKNISKKYEKRKTTKRKRA